MQLIVNLINSYFYNDTVITLMVTFSDLDLKYLRAEFSISQNHISKVQSELKRTGHLNVLILMWERIAIITIHPDHFFKTISTDSSIDKPHLKQ